MAKKPYKYDEIWDTYLKSLGYKKSYVTYKNETQLVYTNTGIDQDPEISLLNKIYNSKGVLRICLKTTMDYCAGIGQFITKCKQTKTDEDFLSAFDEYSDIILPLVFTKCYQELLKYHIIGIESEERAILVLQEHGYTCEKSHVFEDFKGIDLYAKKDNVTYTVQVKSFMFLERRGLNKIVFKGTPTGLHKIKDVDLFVIFERHLKDGNNFYKTCLLLKTSSINGPIEIDEKDSYNIDISEDVIDTYSDERMKILKQKEDTKNSNSSNLNISPLF